MIVLAIVTLLAVWWFERDERRATSGPGGTRESGEGGAEYRPRPHRRSQADREDEALVDGLIIGAWLYHEFHDHDGDAASAEGAWVDDWDDEDLEDYDDLDDGDGFDDWF